MRRDVRRDDVGVGKHDCSRRAGRRAPRRWRRAERHLLLLLVVPRRRRRRVGTRGPLCERREQRIVGRAVVRGRERVFVDDLVFLLNFFLRLIRKQREP